MPFRCRVESTYRDSVRRILRRFFRAQGLRTKLTSSTHTSYGQMALHGFPKDYAWKRLMKLELVALDFVLGHRACADTGRGVQPDRSAPVGKIAKSLNVFVNSVSNLWCQGILQAVHMGKPALLPEIQRTRREQKQHPPSKTRNTNIFGQALVIARDD